MKKGLRNDSEGHFVPHRAYGAWMGQPVDNKLAAEMTHWNPQAANPAPPVSERLKEHFGSIPQYAYKGLMGAVIGARQYGEAIARGESAEIPEEVRDAALNFAPIGMTKKVSGLLGGEGGKWSGKVRSEVTGAHSGQVDASALAYDGDSVIGKADYSIFRGKPYLNMVEVLPEHRKKGVAERLIRNILDESGSKYQDLQWGYLTPEGSKLKEALDRRFLK